MKNNLQKTVQKLGDFLEDFVENASSICALAFNKVDKVIDDLHVPVVDR